MKRITLYVALLIAFMSLPAMAAFNPKVMSLAADEPAYALGGTVTLTAKFVEPGPEDFVECAVQVVSADGDETVKVPGVADTTKPFKWQTGANEDAGTDDAGWYKGRARVTEKQAWVYSKKFAVVKVDLEPVAIWSFIEPGSMCCNVQAAYAKAKWRVVITPDYGTVGVKKVENDEEVVDYTLASESLDGMSNGDVFYANWKVGLGNYNMDVVHNELPKATGKGDGVAFMLGLGVQTVKPPISSPGSAAANHQKLESADSAPKIRTSTHSLNPESMTILADKAKAELGVVCRAIANF